jgi:O-acetyl-ADP-ribose deacetylase (regulator of RNase III)
MAIKIIVNDITTLSIDAIVNAANNTLLGGGGVDGAIHKAAGKELLEECKELQGCPTGAAKMTDAYNLPCRKVIHTVGPVWQKDSQDQAALLENCYVNSFALACKNSLETIAFPAISTGVYGYPKSEASFIALSVAKDHEENMREIIFCCFSDEDAEIYQSNYIALN